jgi:hypothetical protein
MTFSHMTDESNQPEPNFVEKPREHNPAHEIPMEELREIAREIASSYPPPRLGTELVLLEIDPHRAHAYWNIDVEDYRAAVTACGDPAPPLLLRVHDVTGVEFDGTNSNSHFDLQVQGLQGHWYVDLWRDGRSHLAELGLRRADGRLELLARSNVVSTPPAAESPHYHTEAVNTAATDPSLRFTDLTIDPDLNPSNLDVETGAEIDLNPPPLTILPAPDPQAYRAPDADVLEADAGAPILPFDEATPPTPAPSEEARPFPVPPGAEIQPTTYPPIAPEIRESDHPPESLAAEPVAADREQRGDERPDWPSADDLARFVFDAPAVADAPPSSGLVAHAPLQPLSEASEVHSPSAEMTGETDAAASPAPTPPTAPRPAHSPSAPSPSPAPALPLENYVSLISAEHGRSQVALEVNVELHIYGRAKPGMHVSLYGQPVPLRPDGSFSIRKPLPHGAVVLPLLAIDPPAQA